MLKTKTFDSESLMNVFLSKNNITVVSVETKTVKYDTGIPFMDGSSFISDREIIKLWYNI